jgi:glc operon protein GlcG
MPHITRNHSRLTLEGARAVLAAAQRRAEEIRIPMDIAVVDEGGHLLVFERMEGAKPSSIAISMLKARTAAMRRAPTGPAMMGDQVNLPTALGLAIAAPDYQTPIRGGVPLVVGDEFVGAIGVSAGTEDQDFDVARAGAAVLAKV